MSDKIIELDITDLAFDGKSVGHLDGKVIFCNGGLPGERIKAEIVRSKPRYNQAVIKEIIKPGEFRIDPVCSHYDICGGCTWQDLDYSQQLKYKEHQVKACIERLSGLDEVAINRIIACKEQFYYRNKMEYSFHVHEEDNFHLGLHHRGRYDEVFDLQACHLQSEESNKIVAELRSFVRDENIPVYDVHNHTGYMRFLVIREGKRTGQKLINIVTNYGDFPVQDRFVDRLLNLNCGITTIVHNQNGQKSNIAVGEIETVLYGDGYIEEEICNHRFQIMANSFFQTNSNQAEVLYDKAFEILQPDKADNLFDLYCGTGTIGIIAASKVKEVTGVELVSDAVRIARENARLNNVENITFYEGNVKDILKDNSFGEKLINSIVIDPPRAGMHPKALKYMLKFKPEKILYISCNPATFARDAKEIAAEGYKLPSVTPVDMFPHTKHIELIGLFNRI